MPNASVVVTMPYTTGLPEDVSVNTFHFMTDGPVGEAGPDIRDRLLEFYNTAAPSPGVNPLSYWLSAHIDRSGLPSTITVYDLADLKPRAPRYSTTFFLGAPSNTTSLPFEVAACASFAGEPVSGIPAARRRGRIFLGPLTTAANDPGSATVPSRLNEQVRLDLVGASRRMAGVSGDGLTWCVWSRVSQAMVPIVRGWVDDAFDTQRRRGNAPNVRTNWTVSV